MKNKVFWIAISAFIILCLSFNYYGGVMLSTIAILLLYGMVVVATDNMELSLVPIVLVFLSSTSEITTNVLGMNIPRETIHNVFFLLCMVKILISGRLKVNTSTYRMFIYLFIAYITSMQALFIKPTQGLAVLSQCFVAIKACDIIINPISDKNAKILKAFSIVLLLSLFGEFIYGTVTPHDILASKSVEWRADQFGGIFDPNNCSIHFFIGMIFLLFYKECYKPSFRLVILLFYCFVIILTVSFSGLVGMILFLGLLMYNQLSGKNRKQMIVIMVLLAGAGIYVVASGVLSLLGDSGIPGLSSLAMRMNDMSEALSFGDTNALTSNRENLTLMYMAYFLRQGSLTQFFGDAHLFKDIVAANEVASHNFYVDMLLQYGYFGVGILAIALISVLIHYYKRRSFSSFVIALWFIVLFYTRTLPEYFLFFTLICHDKYVKFNSQNISSSYSL